MMTKTEVESSPGRIIGFDVARAAAFVGMVVVNFKVAMGAGERGAGWLVWLVGLLDGRAAATFIVLAGVGLSLLSRKGRLSGDRERIRQDRRTLLKRALFLFVVGLAYIPVWPADILHFYGVYIAISAFLLTLPDRRLWQGAAVFTFGFITLLLLFDYDAGWNWETLDYVGFWTVPGMIRHIFFNGFHPVFPWLAFMLVGIWLGRQDVADGHVRQRILGTSVFIVVVAEAASWALRRVFSGETALLLGTDPIPPMPLYIVAGAAMATAVIMVCVELAERFPNGRWLPTMSATGQLALTLYVAHVVLGMGVLQAIGRLENQSLIFAVTNAMIFSVLAVWFAHRWRKRFQRGPLEWLMRQLT